MKTCSTYHYINYIVSRNRSNTSRGGVCIYVKDTIQFEERNDLRIFDEGKLESIFIETTNMRKNIVVGEIYGIPNSNVALSLEYYDKISPEFGAMLLLAQIKILICSSQFHTLLQRNY